jgi:hypothetical protein
MTQARAAPKEKISVTFKESEIDLRDWLFQNYTSPALHLKDLAMAEMRAKEKSK